MWDCILNDFKVLGSEVKDLKAQVVFLSLVSYDGNDAGRLPEASGCLWRWCFKNFPGLYSAESE